MAELDDRELERTLGELGERLAYPRADLWPAVRQRISRGPSRRLWAWPRLAPVAVTLGVILLVVLALSPAGIRIFSLPGVQIFQSKATPSPAPKPTASAALTFGMDSAISRTLQLVAQKGEAASQIPLCMTQLFVARAHEQVFDMLREMLMWMSQDEEWGREIRDINTYYSLDRVNTFSLRRKIAKHVIEAGGYAL